MKSTAKLLIILAVFITIISCTPECKEVGLAPAEELPKGYFDALFPYAENQNIKFLKNGRDTLIFYNQDFKNGYNYTFTQEDCTRKIPLGYKSLTFYDSLNSNTFRFYYYKNQFFYTYFAVSINNKTICNNGVGDIIILSPPYISVDIGKNHYDTLSYKSNVDGDYFYFKTYQTGMVKFKIDNNIFELIP